MICGYSSDRELRLNPDRKKRNLPAIARRVIKNDRKSSMASSLSGSQSLGFVRGNKSGGGGSEAAWIPGEADAASSHGLEGCAENQDQMKSSVNAMTAMPLIRP
jgi:hypothetical protein